MARASDCAGCHRKQAASQPLTLMAHATVLPGANPVLASHPKLRVRKGAYTYTVQTHGDQSTYSVTDGVDTLTLPIHWSLGAQAQTWVLERDGKFYESLMSYYPSIDGLDITTGDDSIVPTNLVQAMGRELSPSDTRSCFQCHATNAVVGGKLALESMKPGVACEHCHLGAPAHAQDAAVADFDSAPPKLKDLTSEDLSNFCGQCHRTWETVVRNRLRGEANVRFQPYRLANSKCFNGADPRISCIACHDPHVDVVRGTASYDAKCLACHATSTQNAAKATSEARACPVAKSNCASCHMPKVNLPSGHLRFTDHQIRIVRPGEPYPN
jgi:Cytochrome c554 and c-prime